MKMNSALICVVVLVFAIIIPNCECKLYFLFLKVKFVDLLFHSFPDEKASL